MAAKGFWGGQGGAIVDPKRSFRWLVSFGNNAQLQNGQSAVGLQEWYAKSANKPRFSIGETPHQFINHTFYYPGKVTWQDVTMTMVDAVDPNTASKIIQKVATGGYNPSIIDATATPFICKRKLVYDKFIISQYDCSTELEELVEQWTLHNAWIKSVQFGKLDYATEDMIDIELTIKYDWASYDAKQGGVTPGGIYWAPGRPTPLDPAQG